MNKRQKKKKGLLTVEKVYSNYGKKKNETTVKNEAKQVKDKKVEEEVKVQETLEQPAIEEAQLEKEEKEEN